MNYCDPKFVTTTCFESVEESYKKYNEEIIKQNIEKISKLNCSKILFGIDACNLEKTFASEKYERIIFMFPHVSGRSNIKKNRQLIKNFLISASYVLKKTENYNIFENNCPIDKKPSSVFITLAKGQGGTSYEVDLIKRCNKDSWRINELAQECGYILTDCYLLDAREFYSYQSTGFRNQGKSFHIESGLVHKFELSLKLYDQNENNKIFDNILSDYLKKHNFFVENELYYQNEFDKKDGKNKIIHPFVQLKFLLANYLKKELNKNVNFIIKKIHNQKINMNDIMKLEDSFYLGKINLKENLINIVSGLVIDSHASDFEFEDLSVFEINRFRYEISIHFFDQEITFSTVKSKMIYFFQSLFENSQILQITDLDISVNSKKLVHYKTTNENQFSISINADMIFKYLFAINDERLFYSDDKRIFIKDESLDKEIKFEWIIKPISIENCKWYHDISFWLNQKHSFEYFDFINIVRDVCGDLVKSVQLIDKYSKIDEITGELKKSFCFRLLYESCDKALSRNVTSNIQLNLRTKLTLYMNLQLK